MNFLLAHDQVVLLETAANLWARRSKANDFFAVFCLILSYTCRRYNKTLNDWSSGKLNSEFCFPSTSIFLSASPQERLRVLGKQNSLFILGPVIKCLLSLCLKLFWIMWKGICGQVSMNTLDGYPRSNISTDTLHRHPHQYSVHTLLAIDQQSVYSI